MTMLTWLRLRVKWWIAGRELAELQRWQVQWHLYRRWLAEFPDVGEAMDSLQAAAKGERLNNCLPAHGDGPWSVEALRDRLRAKRDQRHQKTLEE